MADGARLNLLLVAAAAVPLVLAAVNFVVAQGNSGLRAEVNRRQQQINQGVQLAHVNQALIRQIATTAINSQDDKLRELLSHNGVAINPSPAPPAGDKTE